MLEHGYALTRVAARACHCAGRTRDAGRPWDTTVRVSSSTAALEDAFVGYLGSALDVGAARELVDALDAAGLGAEAAGLRRAGAGDPAVTGPAGRRTFHGRRPPVDSGAGDAWFDPVELVHMVLVPATPDLSSDVAGWVATRPCAVWQLRAFLRLAGVVGAGRVPHGYLDARRFAAVDGHHAVTDVFHDEAIAYAHWFGKSITGRFTLQAASALLSPDELDALMPPGTALWDAAEYLEGEREAVTWANLFADDDDEDGDDRAGRPTERRKFGEWERHPHIGFATFVRLRSGLLETPTRRSYLVDLDGAAPR